MPTVSFSRELSVPAGREDIWSVVTDVDILTKWISLVGEARVVTEMEHYQAQLRDRIGRFSLTADLDIRMVEYQRPEYLVVSMQGEDRHVSSRIAVDGRLDLLDEPDSRGTRLRATGKYEVTGPVATLGASTIRKKADRIIADFFGNMEAHFP